MMRKKERRRRPRIDVALPIQIRYNEREIFTVSKNISVLGTYIETSEELPSGADLTIQIRLPAKDVSADGGRQINCSGSVFRCQLLLSEEPGKKYGIGLFFRSFSRGGEKTLSDYIEKMVLLEQKAGKIYMRRRQKQKKQAKRGGKK